MSYIFQALKRAAEERESGVVAVRRSAAATSVLTRRPWWAWAAVGALALNAVALLVVFGPSLRGALAPPRQDTARAPSSAGAVSSPTADRPSDATGSVSSGAAVPAPAKPAEPAAPRDDGAGRARVRERPAPATAAPASGESKSPTAAPATGQVTRATPPATSGEVKRTTPAPAAPPSETAASRDVPKAPAPPSVAAQANAATPERAAPVPAPVPRGGAAPAPDRPAAAIQPGNDVASRAQKLSLQALVYAESPRQRMVFINGRKYVEGDTVEGDLRLETITEEGALLSYQGQRYLLRDASSR